MLLTVASISFFISVVALYVSWKAYMQSATQTLAQLEKSRLTAIETELTELADSYESVHTSLKKLRSRITMRQNRQNGAARTEPGEPDWRTDPEGYKRAMRLKHLRR